jgi:hypothetical protein
MKTYLLVSGTIFALFSAAHFFIAYEHWGRPAADAWAVPGPVLIGLGGLGLALWAWRLARSAGSGPHDMRAR